MPYILSLLDKSPIADGGTGAEALANTVKLARRADQIGYHRFWLAEHHASPTLAGSAPEILVSTILAQTEHIRVGTGGVMLQHYSPFKVAETFKVLASLYPDRVDLGIGKAPGGLPHATRALQAFHDSARKPDFAAALAELDGFLNGSLPEDHALAQAVAGPEPLVLPQKILLGGSPDSAALAARLGWDFSYAGHFNGDPENIGKTLAVYREATGRSPSLALYAHASDEGGKVTDQLKGISIFSVGLPNGQRVNLPTLEAAAEFARQGGFTEYTTEERFPHVIAGTAEQVRRELSVLSERFGVSEFILDNPVRSFAERLRSLELLAPRAASLAA